MFYEYLLNNLLCSHIRNVLEPVTAQANERSLSPSIFALRQNSEDSGRVLRRRTFNSADCRRAEALTLNRKSCQNFERTSKKSIESHSKERSYIAARQFSYNKLRNEQGLSMKKAAQKPKRPPQPKLDGKVAEGNLIDLSSPDGDVLGDLKGKLSEGRSFSAECILDAPIEVATEEEIVQDENLPSPMYENSREIDHTSWQSVMMEAYEAAARSQEVFDPFDTSHVHGDGLADVQADGQADVQTEDNWDCIRKLDSVRSHTPTSESGFFTPPERETPVKDFVETEYATTQGIINEIVEPIQELNLQYSSKNVTNVYDTVEGGSFYQELYPILPVTYQNIPDAWNSPRVYPDTEAQKLKPHRPAPSIPSSSSSR